MNQPLLQVLTILLLALLAQSPEFDEFHFEYVPPSIRGCHDEQFPPTGNSMHVLVADGTFAFCMQVEKFTVFVPSTQELQEFQCSHAVNVRFLPR